MLLLADVTGKHNGKRLLTVQTFHFVVASLFATPMSARVMQWNGTKSKK